MYMLANQPLKKYFRRSNHDAPTENSSSQSLIAHFLPSLARLLLTLCLAQVFLNLTHGQGLSPSESLQRIKVPSGLRADLIASEPLVLQPVAIDWDNRGRLWVLQYLQYPNPEGLNRTQVDRYSRTLYDQIPPPPPHGPRGSDRLSILSDSDNDGIMDSSRDFVSGLNLASGFAFGHSGVFVLNVPYLLFYPDLNQDDHPDADPIVLLEGFGMQDAHSVANSLCFGPDGWLYGCQGSTVTSVIRGIEFQQGVWRYHPKTHAFELFCEGGGNSWGLDFDASGQLLYSTNYGGYVLLHGLQGAYYVKSFAKHGALHNPYTFGYFEHAPHKNFTGGHVTVGGFVYQEELLGGELKGKYLAADLLGHGVNWHRISPYGSTFSTEHGDALLESNDTWFAPSDMTSGPDGAIYIADWHDARMAHPDPDAQWDRSNGRIYRITKADGPKSVESSDLAKLSDESILERLNLPSQWHVRRARQELIRRYASMQTLDTHAPPQLIEYLKRSTFETTDPKSALEAFWTWTSLIEVSESDLSELLKSPNPDIRRWTVRWIGDSHVLGRSIIGADLAHQLDKLAETETDIHVRQQLACTASRLPAAIAMPIINANINRSIDTRDPFIPLLWWWAVERHCIDGNQEVLKRFERPTLWKSELGRDKLLGLLVRRFAAEPSLIGETSLVRLLKACPSPQERFGLWKFIDEGMQLRPVAEATTSGTKFNSLELNQLLAKDLQTSPENLALLRVGIRLNHSDAKDLCRGIIQSIDPDQSRLIGYLSALGIQADKSDSGVIREILDRTKNDAVAIEAAGLLAKFDDSESISFLIEKLKSSQSIKLRDALISTLCSRYTSARQLLTQIHSGKLSPESISIDQARGMSVHNDPQIDALITKYWGRLKVATPEEKLAEVRRLNNDLRAAKGDRAAGKALFEQHCGSCHKLFGLGQQLGPDLTSANRKDRDFLLVSIVDPSSIIRREYLATAIRTKDERILTGIIQKNESGKITLQPQRGESIDIPVDEIAEMKPSEVSLMPEDLHRNLSPQSLRDLFEYLQSEPSAN